MQAQQPVHLTYRGLPYEQTAVTLATEPTPMTVRYRGLAYELQRPVNLPRVTQHNLVYRGVPYHRSPKIPIHLSERAIPCHP